MISLLFLITILVCHCCSLAINDRKSILRKLHAFKNENATHQQQEEKPQSIKRLPTDFKREICEWCDIRSALLLQQTSRTIYKCLEQCMTDTMYQNGGIQIFADHA